MIEKSFTLVPFPDENIPAVTLTGRVSLGTNRLEIQYFLAGDLAEILLPDPSSSPGRKDELWKSTCFEFFLALDDKPHYWECNISPAGDWNVYSMDFYRRVGFREETSIPSVENEVHRASDEFRLTTRVDLTPILLQAERIHLGIAAILQMRDGRETYWALTHPAPQPDFHNREGFILALEAQTHLSR